MDFSTAITIDKVFLVCLTICALMNRHTKLFSVTLINLFFALAITLSMGAIFSAGAQVFTIVIVFHQMLLLLAIVGFRIVTKDRFYVTDLLLMILPFIQILSIGMMYTAKVKQGLDYMDGIYSATAPTLYVLTVFALGFPTVFKFIANRSNKENSDGSGTISIYFRGYYMRYRSILGV